MTNTLALASRLRELDDTELHAAIVARGVSGTGVHDFFDLAEALLERESVHRALARLDRTTLAVVAAAAESGRPVSSREVIAQLTAWGAEPEPSLRVVDGRLGLAARLLLIEHTHQLATVYDAVRVMLAEWSEHGPVSPRELAAFEAPAVLFVLPPAATESRDRLAAEHAFAAVAGVSELVSQLAVEPAQELQKGGLSLPSVKRLSSALNVEFDAVPGMISVAARAGLIAIDGRLWLATDAGTDWQKSPTAQRWATLAAAWLDALPADIRDLMAQRAHAEWGESLRALVAWNYPAGGGDIQQRVTDFTRDAELLGLTAEQAPGSAGTLLLEDGIAAATERMGSLLPAEVDRVYLQHDLSIVAPGPLTPAIDTRLRSMADVEGRALASTYRVSEASVNRAIGSGESADALLAFLTEISLSGVPQPLEYLVTETARRFGRVRVGAIAERRPSSAGADRPPHPHARSIVHSDDDGLLRTLEVDQAIATLGLEREGAHALVSRFDRDDVFWALTDARYPVAAEDADGAIVNLRRSRTIPAGRRTKTDPAGELVVRLRSAEAEAGPDAARAWLTRQLDIAVRGRVGLVVSVVMPDGRITDYALEPTGVGGGRLRGRDRTADIERTLPLSSIQGIRPAERPDPGQSDPDA